MQARYLMYNLRPETLQYVAKDDKIPLLTNLILHFVIALSISKNRFFTVPLLFCS